MRVCIAFDFRCPRDLVLAKWCGTFGVIISCPAHRVLELLYSSHCLRLVLLVGGGKRFTRWLKCTTSVQRSGRSKSTASLLANHLLLTLASVYKINSPILTKSQAIFRPLASGLRKSNKFRSCSDEQSRWKTEKLIHLYDSHWVRVTLQLTGFYLRRTSENSSLVRVDVRTTVFPGWAKQNSDTWAQTVSTDTLWCSLQIFEL